MMQLHFYLALNVTVIRFQKGKYPTTTHTTHTSTPSHDQKLETFLVVVKTKTYE
jgi:hypothetical protein